ncbi:MAG: GTPase ObgE [Elusimicrobiota bacterium]|jgi:GTP-binding protein|nr:GTPase ObgE [Elusimicrobiota bacterium]
MFVDKTHLELIAGRGGDGCISFRREKYVAYGGPNGGNGGKGGSIFCKAAAGKNTLLDLSYKTKIKAEDGVKGLPNDKTGKCGRDTIIEVPQGTLIYKNGELLADLSENEQTVLVVAGGRGGRGNASFKTQKWTAPRIAEKGQDGEIAQIDLELQLIADIGLVGLPNAGKSTLLSKISAAKPKISNYPFTTLTPNLGVVDFRGKRFVIADIPGIIEGAHTGKGLGLEFLRHIRRTKVLVHIIDASGFNADDPYKNYQTINKELKKYSKFLAKKNILIVLNKMDLPDSQKHLKTFSKKLKNKKIVAISAATSSGLDDLLLEMVKMLNKPIELNPEQEIKAVAVKKYIYEPDFVIKKKDGIFVVSGKKIETLTQMTKFNAEDALRRYQNILKKMGLETELEKQSIKVGDVVKIGDFEFVYSK